MDIINHGFEASIRSMTSKVAHSAVTGNQLDKFGRKVWGFVPGDVCTYDSHGADSVLNSRTGQRVRVLRALTEDEIDLAEAGPMYAVQFEDGRTTDAFEDELIGLLPATASCDEDPEGDWSEHEFKPGDILEFHPTESGDRLEMYDGMEVCVVKRLPKEGSNPRYGVKFSDGLVWAVSESQLNK